MITVDWTARTEPNRVRVDTTLIELTPSIFWRTTRTAKDNENIAAPNQSCGWNRVTATSAGSTANQQPQRMTGAKSISLRLDEKLQDRSFQIIKFAIKSTLEDQIMTSNPTSQPNLERKKTFKKEVNRAECKLWPQPEKMNYSTEDTHTHRVLFSRCNWDPVHASFW